MDREVLLTQPLAAVFRLFTTPARLADWLPEVAAAPAGDAVLDEAGAAFVLTLRAGGREIAGRGELIAYEPPRSAAYRLLAGPHTYVLRLTCTATSDGATRVHIHQAGGDQLAVDLTRLAADGQLP